MAIYESQVFKIFFLQNCKNLEMEIFGFYGVIVEPINLHTRWTPQNDCLNPIFVKGVYIVGARNGSKMVIYGVPSRLGESDFTVCPTDIGPISWPNISC